MGHQGRPEEVSGMTNLQLNGYLEAIAKQLEAQGYHEAAEIVRQNKI